MSDPIGDLVAGFPLDDQIRKKISLFYKSRGNKALDIVDQDRVARYRDFFVVTGDTGVYVVEEDFCSCGDYFHRKRTCAHVLAVKIARATGRYDLIDHWFYEDIRDTIAPL
jgi:predicted nucleic acid-binding Zn finger protein